MFADSPTILKTTRRSMLATLGLAAVPAVAGAYTTPTHKPCPAEVASLAREWVALIDRGARLAAGGADADGDEMDALHDEAGELRYPDDEAGAYTRAINAMREHGIVGVMVGGRLLIDTDGGDALPGSRDEYRARLFDPSTFPTA